MKVTVLGCGPAGGVPSVSGGWGKCDPTNPLNRRRRPSLLVEEADTAILIDTSPDLRDQLLDAGVRRLDAVLFTHIHADHLHGIDDLREVNRIMRAPLPVYATNDDLRVIGSRFGYVFAPLEGEIYYKPVLQPIEITGSFRIGPIWITPFEQDHGSCSSLGFRMNDVAYSTDFVRLNDDALRVLAGVGLWIVDAFTDRPEHHTHASLDVALDWIGHVRPARAVLTHMSGSLDYEAVKRRLPAHIEPAYDGMVIEI